jgi:adenylate cyclase
VDAAAAQDLPALRAGVAFGPALARAGDFYGNSVNLASRVTGAARPGSVLCTREIRDTARDGFSWSAAGRHRLKGVSGHTPLYRPRAAADDDGASPHDGAS